MISRKATKALADAYAEHFETTRRASGYGERVNQLDQAKLNEFLYEESYEAWFLQLMKGSAISSNTRTLRNSIMGIHTAETLAPSTPNWSSDKRQQLAQELLRKLSEDILNLYTSIPIFGTDHQGGLATDVLRSLAATLSRPADANIKKLQSQLEIDGYVYRDGHLYSTESSVVDERAEQDYLESMFNSLNLSNSTVIKHHLQLSEEHYINGKYDDSISNLRKVLDAILKQLTENIYLKVKGSEPPPALLKNATDTRIFLEKQGLITAPERETLEKTYGLLSITGGHPYIAERDQARLMRHLALTFSQFVLLRYQGFLSNSP